MLTGAQIQQQDTLLLDSFFFQQKALLVGDLEHKRLLHYPLQRQSIQLCLIEADKLLGFRMCLKSQDITLGQSHLLEITRDQFLCFVIWYKKSAQSIQIFVVKPEIYSGLKITKFCKFTPQEAGLRQNHLLDNRKGTEDFTTKSQLPNYVAVYLGT